MAKYRKVACWLLLIVLLVASSLVMSVGVTQARYQNTSTVAAVLTPSGAGVSSNCLVTKQDAPRTVLLGQVDLNGSLNVPFWMLSSEADAKEKLNWGVSNAEYAQYLNISVFVGYEALKANSELELLEDVQMDLMLCLEPTDFARNYPHEALKIPVHVTWGDEMWGTFQVILPEVKDEFAEEIPDLLIPEPTEAPTQAPVAEPTEEPTEAPTKAPSAEENNTEETVEPTTEPVSVANYRVTFLSEIIPVTEPTEEPTTEPETEPATTQTNPAGYESLIQMKALPIFHPSQSLPVRIELPKEITAVRLGVQTTYGEKTYFETFPNYTMFSLDGGASYYMVYGTYVPELLLEHVTELPMLLDFRFAEITCSYVDENEQEKIDLAMEAYVGETLIKTGSTAVIISPEPSGELVLRPRVQQTNDEAQTEEIIIENDTELQLLGPVLTFDNRLDIIFPVEWKAKELKLSYSVDILTMTEENKLQYVPVELTRDGLFVVYISDEQMHKLVFRLGDQFIEPGTYRLNMTWTYEGECFLDTKTTFFIQYSARTNEELSSQEVPNDN